MPEFQYTGTVVSDTEFTSIASVAVCNSPFSSKYWTLVEAYAVGALFAGAIANVIANARANAITAHKTPKLTFVVLRFVIVKSPC